MPQFFIPRKSGIHRAACLALFRALLRQTTRLGLAPPQRGTLESRIRKGFRDNLFEQSPSGILAALRRGHALLRVLHDGVHKSLKSQAHVFDFATIPVMRASSPYPKSRAVESKTKAVEFKTKAANVRSRGPMVWPQPNTPSIFDRPFPKVSGRRRVPRLVCTNGFPFLRFKKPQSQFLGRIIRDDIRLYQKRSDQIWKLRELVNLGDDEDRWDTILESTCGLKRDKEEGSWVHETSQAKHQVMIAQYKHRVKRVEMAQKMQDIVDKEQALADLERVQRRTEKHQERKRRRLSRKAEGITVLAGEDTNSSGGDSTGVDQGTETISKHAVELG